MNKAINLLKTEEIIDTLTAQIDFKKALINYIGFAKADEREWLDILLGRMTYKSLGAEHRIKSLQKKLNTLIEEHEAT